MEMETHDSEEIFVTELVKTAFTLLTIVPNCLPAHELYSTIKLFILLICALLFF